MSKVPVTPERQALFVAFKKELLDTLIDCGYNEDCFFYEAQHPDGSRFILVVPDSIVKQGLFTPNEPANIDIQNLQFRKIYDLHTVINQDGKKLYFTGVYLVVEND